MGVLLAQSADSIDPNNGVEIGEMA